jgi:hypothetical protein
MGLALITEKLAIEDEAAISKAHRVLQQRGRISFVVLGGFSFLQ